MPGVGSIIYDYYTPHLVGVRIFIANEKWPCH